MYDFIALHVSCSVPAGGLVIIQHVHVHVHVHMCI